MDKPADVITSLIKEFGMTEQAIADQLAAFGVQVSQSTIHRIKTGEIEQPNMPTILLSILIGVTIILTGNRPPSFFTKYV